MLTCFWLCTDAQFQVVLDIIGKHPGKHLSPTSLVAKDELQHLRSGSLGSAFRVVDIADKLGCPHEDIKVYVRHSPLQSLVDLINECWKRDTVTWRAEQVFDQQGDRIYNEFSSSDRWLRTQQKYDDDMPIVWFVVWSDKVHFDKKGGSVGHPLTVACGEITNITFPCFTHSL
jgi:hypothetical protein